MSTASHPRGQLKRTRSGRMIGGVCAGLAGYFDLDPAIVRLLFIVLALAQGAGVLLYLVLLVALPEEAGPTAPPAVPAHPAGSRHRRGVLAGGLLVALGAYLLVANLGWLGWWDWKFAGPATLIAAGLVLFWRLK